MPEIKEYPCPNCGGQLAFDSSLQKMKCTSCDSTFEVEDAESYAKCKNQEDDLTWNREDETFSDNDNLSVFTCKSCGGEILQEKDDISSSCPYCGNAIVNTGKFCSECGKPKKSSFCPECGKEVPAGSKFCPSCGKQL